MKRLAGLTLDWLLALFALPSAVILNLTRRIGLQRLPLTSSALRWVGLLPIRRHYYEPYLDVSKLSHPLQADRHLPGIDLNVEGQLRLLEQLTFEHELQYLSRTREHRLDFRLNNGSFESGDAEYLYQLIRFKKPRRIVEVGSGNSTLIARDAVLMNAREDKGYACEHICVEPFEAPWLESAGVRTIRQKVEDVDRSIFAQLSQNDLLFIDSSHVIRPQGDVVVEYLEILPTLSKGVIVHVHDIFSPKDYLREWLVNRQWLWNEQYLLEAFLTHNRDWTVLGGLNYLHHHHYEKLQRVCPYLTRTREPGSFYIQRIH